MFKRIWDWIKFIIVKYKSFVWDKFVEGMELVKSMVLDWTKESDILAVTYQLLLKQFGNIWIVNRILNSKVFKNGLVELIDNVSSDDFIDKFFDGIIDMVRKIVYKW